MSDSKDVTEAIAAWAMETCPELEGSYDHATDERYKGLPDVAIELTNFRYTDAPTDGRLGRLQQIEQTRMKVWDVELIVVVPPDPAEVAEDLLKDLADRLCDNVLVNSTLGGRVSWVNNTPRASFRPPLVEFDDGTRGRIVTLFLQVGKQVEV